MFSSMLLNFFLIALHAACSVDCTKVWNDVDTPGTFETGFSNDQKVLASTPNSELPPLHTIESGGILRSYRIQVPDNYQSKSDETWPLIVDFHGRNGSAEGQWNNSQYFLNDASRNYFVLYPNGCLGRGDKPGDRPERAWQGAPYANTSCNDILFTNDIVMRTMKDYPIDVTRIYASGKSNGGGFVDTLACSSGGDIFAAFAMAAAALYNDTLLGPDTCAGKRPRRILEAHGTEDDVIPIDGRTDLTTPNIGQWTNRWGVRNGCNPATDLNTSFPIWGTNTSYTCHGQQSFIQQYRVDGSGHCWPTTGVNTDTKKDHGLCHVYDLDFTQSVVDFFGRWQNT